MWWWGAKERENRIESGRERDRIKRERRIVREKRFQVVAKKEEGVLCFWHK